MNKINIANVPVEHRRSPRGRFDLNRQHISLALGGIKDTGPWGGGHPFDIELTTLAPGCRNYPLHSHAAQTEHYIIISGNRLLHQGTEHPLLLATGDHVMCHPGEPHQIENNGDSPLIYYVISDQHRADITSYPNTGKRQIKPEYRVVMCEDTEYYAGEE